jgi:CHAT domain
MSDLEYEDFTVRIEQGGDGQSYRVSVTESAGGEGRSTFIRAELPPISTPGLQDLAAAKTYGWQLFKAIFKDSVWDRFVETRSVAQNKNAVLRIRIDLTDIPELAQLPWEYIYNAEQNLFYARDRHPITTVVRYPSLDEPVEEPRVEPPMAPPMDIPKPLEPLMEPPMDIDRPKKRKRISELQEPIAAGPAPKPVKSRGGTRNLKPVMAAKPAAEAPPLLIRYPNLDCPNQVIFKQKFSLFVQLMLRAPQPESEAIWVEDTSEPGQLPEVEVVLRARGFDIEGSNTKTLRVERDGDSEARFALIPASLGEQEIRVDFYQQDRRIGTARRNVLVVEMLGAVEITQPAEPAFIELKTAFNVPPPDLELCVELDRNDDRTLYFTLHSTQEAVGYHHARAGQVTLRNAPLEKIQKLCKEMSQMAADDPSTTQEQAAAQRRLASLGNNLWDELIPEELKREYWQFKPRAKSLLVTSDEPWIPWEMVKPYRFDETDQREDDPFWCQQFAISRWLSGPGTADELLTGPMRPVAPTQINLAAVKAEVEFLEGLKALRPGVVPLTAYTDRSQVIDWLEQGEFAFLHFACHGMFDATQPGDSALELSDGPLRPSDIRARFGGRRPRPLIFINACHGGRMEFSFTGLGGWADRLVKEARVGAFIGAMWEVNDGLALQFARRFYQALLKDNLTLAEAFRQARAEILQAKPYNPTWLAYVLYADPEGRLKDRST